MQPKVLDKQSSTKMTEQFFAIRYYNISSIFSYAIKNFRKVENNENIDSTISLHKVSLTFAIFTIML